jgi:hypothetical protein
MVLVDGCVAAMVVPVLVLVAAEVNVALELWTLVLESFIVGVTEDTVSGSTVVLLLCSVKRCSEIKFQKQFFLNLKLSRTIWRVNWIRFSYLID